MSELEQMGRTLMETALNFTHPRFEDTYPEWSTVCNIGEELVRMSQQVELNENQQIVFEQLCLIYDKQVYKSKMQAIYIFINEGMSEEFLMLDKKESDQVLAAFAEWGKKEVAE